MQEFYPSERKPYDYTSKDDDIHEDDADDYDQDDGNSGTQFEQVPLASTVPVDVQTKVSHVMIRECNFDGTFHSEHSRFDEQTNEYVCYFTLAKAHKFSLLEKNLIKSKFLLYSLDLSELEVDEKNTLVKISLKEKRGVTQKLKTGISIAILCGVLGLIVPITVKMLFY